MTTESNNIKLIGASNYYAWKDNIVDRLRGQNLWRVTTGEEKAPEKATATGKNDEPTEAAIFEERRRTASYLQRVDAALSMINLSLDRPLRSLTRDCTTPAAAYKAILAHFDKPDVNRDLRDFAELSNIRMGETETILGYIDRINVLIERMTTNDYKFKPAWTIHFILRGLPPSYSGIATIIRTQATVTLDFTRSALLQHESSIINGSAAPEPGGDSLFFVAAKPPGSSSAGVTESSKKSNGASKKKQRSRDNPKAAQGSAAGPKPEQRRRFPYDASLTCTYCTRVGHSVEQCDTKRRAALLQPDRANIAVERPLPPAEMLLIGNTHLIRDERSTWYLDSGASAHMTCRREWLDLFTPRCPATSVVLGNNATLDVKGSGTVRAEVHIGGRTIRVVLRDVLFVPGLTKNLVSTGRLVDLGCVIRLDGAGATIQHPQQSFPPLVARSASNMLIVDLHPLVVENQALSANTRRTVTLDHLHLCLGHIGADRLKSAALAASDITIDTTSELSSCTACIRAKQHKRAIGRGPALRSDTLMAVIHSDVCGPFPTRSFTGKVYFVSFIDDFSRHATVYFLREKSEVLARLQDFLAALPEGRRVRTLRSDHGGEYMGNAAQALLRSRGITHAPSPPYTPQYNGVAERFNRSIVEMARAMLFSSDLPRSFWAEAVATAVHIHNRAPSKANFNRSPHELLHGTAPTLGHLHPFGAHAHVLLPDHKRDKLDPRGILARYLGPTHDITVHRMWIPGSRTTTMSRDVIFVAAPHGVSTPMGNGPPCVSDLLDAPVDNQGGQCDELVPGLDQTVNHETLGDDDVLARRIEYDSSISDLLGIGSSPAHSPASSPVTSPRISPVLSPVSSSTSTPSPSPPVSPRATPAVVSSGANRRAVAKAKPVPRPPSTRSRKAPVRLIATCDISQDAGAAMHEPQTYREAMASPDAHLWFAAMQKELRSILDNATWILVPLPPGRRAVDTRWIYKVKRLASGAVDCQKARFVAKGYSQVYGVDYDETYAPVVRMEVLRLLLAHAVLHRLAVHQMDVTTAFLHADIDDKIYVRQPEGFVDKEHPDWVCRLNKSLYGLKQAPLLWNRTIDHHLRSSGFAPTDGDPCVYVRRAGGKLAIISIYVDNCLIIAKPDDIPIIKEVLSSKFTMKDLGVASSILGVEISYDREKGHMELRQRGHIDKLLQTFNMSDCNPASTPMEHGLALLSGNGTTDGKIPYRQVIGKLLYIAIASRPDIAFAVGYLSRFVACYDDTHWIAAKRILRYLKGTRDLAIVYNRPPSTVKADLVPTGYCDADWGANVVDRKSVTGYVFLLAGGPIMWTSKAQTIVALSSTEAEYNSVSETTKQALYVRKFFSSLGIDQSIPVIIHNDNQSTIAIANQQQTTFHSRVKHYDIKLHHVRDTVAKGLIILKHEPTATMPADVLTKALPRVKHNDLLRLLQFSI